MENKVFFSKINDPKTCSFLEEMSAQDVADLINKLQKENEYLKKALDISGVLDLKNESALLKRKLDVAKQNLRDYMAPHMYKSILKDIEDLNEFFDEICRVKK